MGNLALLLAICLCNVVSGTIHNLDEIFKESAAKVLRTTIEAVDLSDVTVIFSNKVQYDEPKEYTNEVIDTITQEYDQSSATEGATEVFDQSYDHENQVTWILDEGLLASTAPQVKASLTSDQKGFDVSVVITEEDQKRLEQTSTKTLTKKSKVTVAAGSKVSVAWNVIEKELEIPWTVEVELSGNLKLTCDKCSDPLPIEMLLRRAALPSGVFKSTSGKLTFLASGYLVTVLGYSDELKIETESIQGEEPEIEEEATDDDVAVADENPTLTAVKGILDIAANNLDEESQWKPWIKMAGGIADLSAGKTDDPQVYLDIAESALDIFNSEQGQNAIEKLKNMTSKVVNKVKGKAETETEKCKGKRNNNKPGCPSRNQPATPPRNPGQPTTRRPRKPNGGTTVAPRPGRTPVPRRPTQKPGQRVTRAPTTTRRTTARSTTRRNPTTTKRTTTTTKKPRTTPKHTTKRTTKKTTKRRG